VFLILGFIDLLSCTPLSATLLSTIFGWGAGTQTQNTRAAIKREMQRPF